MRTKLIISEFRCKFNPEDGVLYRNAVVNNAFTPGTIVSIVDEPDHIYVGYYTRGPHVYGNKIVIKSTCASSVTYRKGRFTGDMSQQQMLNLLSNYVPRFEFLKEESCQPYKRVIQHVTKQVTIGILNGNLTSVEQVWRALAKQAGFSSWKSYKKIKEFGLSPRKVKDLCDDYAAVLDIDICKDDLSNLLHYALITNNKVKLSWSNTRIREEIRRMKSIIELAVIETKSKEPIWGTKLPDIYIPNVGKFRILNTERDIFEIGEKFSNCVYHSFYKPQVDHRYLIVTDGHSICASISMCNLQVDQIRGIHNAHVDSITETNIKRFLPQHISRLIEQNYFDVEPPQYIPAPGIDFIF